MKLNKKRDMGLIIQHIEPNGRVFKDGRLKIGDRIIEINEKTLIGVDFKRAQEFLREALKTAINNTGLIEIKVIRYMDAYINYPEQFQNEENIKNFNNINQNNMSDNHFLKEETDFINERPIGVIENNYDYIANKENSELNNINFATEYQNEETTQRQNTINPSNTSSNNNFITNTSSFNLNALNTRKMGKKISIQLIKGPQGLGFKLAARDNCTPGEFSPIYIKNILPKGAAITDGRLQRGDRLLEVNKMDMTEKTLHEAVNILRNTKLGSCVELVVSRQIINNPNNSNLSNTSLLTNKDLSTIAAAQLPRELEPHYLEDKLNENINHNNEDNQKINPNLNTSNLIINNSNETNKRQLLTFEIALNDTGSAGLGVSVKGKTKRIEENDCSIDLGIFVKTVINGGAASKDGRLKPNDQLININGFSLLGKSNEEAMLILREAMQVESKPGHIELTVSRKKKLSNVKLNKTKNSQEVDSSIKNCINSDNNIEQISNEKRQIVKIIKNSNSNHLIGSEDTNSRFNRDAPSRRSMSEKRTKIGNSASFGQGQGNNSSIGRFQRNASIQNKPFVETNPRRSKTINTFIDSSTSANQENNSETVNLNKELEFIHQKSKNNSNQQSIINHNIVLSNLSRKSISMESVVQSNNVEELINKFQGKNHPKLVMSPNNKFGTISGFSKLEKTYIANNLQNKDKLTPSIDTQASISSRLRAINRSFRTAVDKSFDAVALNGK
jgi:C-terminal processing protease CtpA/Prc